jgi:glycosyltransferase involved in cell wall biosynthesis
MRVIYLHQYFNTPHMAGGTRSYEMARRLVAAGHDVQMVTTWREPTDRADWFVTNEAGITVHWLPEPYSNHMTYAQRLRAFSRFAWASSRKAAALPGDVVFATSTPLTIALPGIYTARRKRIPFVFEVRDVWPDVPIAMGVITNPLIIALARLLERVAYRNATAVVALAPGMKEAVCRRGVPSSRVHVIPNGCDFDIFADRDITPATLPGASGGHAKSVVYIGTMGTANGVDYIPRLAAEMRRLSGADSLRFYLIGDGSQRHGVEKLSAELGVLNSSVFFIGQLTKREVARWLAAADASIMTYDGPDIVFKDSVSNKFFDSLAARKPVIANFRGFSTQAAVDAGAGFILSRDPSAAAAELLAITSDPAVFKQSAEGAFALAHTRFSRDVLALELERLLTATLASHRSA